MKLKKKKILFVVGTRPDALKMAPVILAARQSKILNPIVCLTAQHREMADEVLRVFKIKPQIDLDLMQHDQQLSDLTCLILQSMQQTLAKVKPDWVAVQGDTTTSFAAALAASYQQIPVAHIEAGLRSYDKNHPFPEETNRVLISHLADLHFAPTKTSCKNLLQEGIEAKRIFVTGNTVVDALMIMRKLIKNKESDIRFKGKLLLVTAHRRENWGKPVLSICQALKTLANRFPDLQIIFPVHWNPNVRRIVMKTLRNEDRIWLTDPLPYPDFLQLMMQADLIMTDSGGVQEEAPSLGKPVLVLRQVTERNEAVQRGYAEIVGTDYKKIVAAASKWLKPDAKIKSKLKSRNPFGDGRASGRIIRILEKTSC